MTDMTSPNNGLPIWGKPQRDGSARGGAGASGAASAYESRPGSAPASPMIEALNRVVGEDKNLSRTMARALRAMMRHMNIASARISLYDRTSGSIYIDECAGLSGKGDGGSEASEERIADRVVETGQAVVRARGSAEEDICFLCVPIPSGERVLGTLSAEGVYGSDETLDADLDLMGEAAAVLALAVKRYLREKVDRAALRGGKRNAAGAPMTCTEGADGCSLYFADAGDLPLLFRAKAVRASREEVAERAGCPIQVNVRFVEGSRRDLLGM
jgi:transcriptional regulator with GAF, ATPase, and Fis domain